MSSQEDTVHGLPRQAILSFDSQFRQSLTNALHTESDRLNDWFLANSTTASKAAWREAYARMKLVRAEIEQLALDPKGEVESLIQEIAALGLDEPLPIKVVSADGLLPIEIAPAPVPPDLTGLPELDSLWRQFTNNRTDHNLRNRLLAHYEKFAWLCIHRHLRLVGLPRHRADEYLGASWTGLVNAANKFNPARGVSFLAYASVAIYRSLVCSNGRVSRGELKYRKLNKLRRQASNSIGRRANDHDLAAFAGMTEQHLAQEFRESAGTRHIVTGEVQSTTRVANTSDVPGPSDRITVVDSLEVALRLVQPNHREVTVRYLAGGATGVEIGHEMGLTRSRIQQIASRSAERIRDQVDADGQLSQAARLARRDDQPSFWEMAGAKLEADFKAAKARLLERETA